MVQLKTHRTALALYGVLLVLPTIALGYLQWHQIVQEQRDELAAVPRNAESAAARFREALRERLESLINSENARPFDHYSNWYFPDSTPEGENVLLASPLRTETRPAGVQAWFEFDLLERADADVELMVGGNPRPDADPRLEAAARELLQRFHEDRELSAQARSRLEFSEYELPLKALAARAATPDDEDCLEAQRMFLQTNVPMVTSPFHVQFHVEVDGTPRLYATRRVLANALPFTAGLQECLHVLTHGLALVQGFFIDPEWFFKELPDQTARSVLGPAERFMRGGEPTNGATRDVIATIAPIADLAIETRDVTEREYGRIQIGVDTANIEQRYKKRAARFAGVALMLAISLATGLWLLWRSIESDLAQARRTENFVAAVTHELRTPLASIKMHGEMLQDGWAKEPAKQQEYYRRIVRETDRLSTLVERVLEKARLSSDTARPVADDLSRAVGALAEPLMQLHEGERPDLEFQLDPNLPAVWMTAEAVRSIVINLVENARKYAPVDFAAPNAEPIRIVTRQDGRRVVLEVQDRGPGVPAEERERVFQAFYRVGNEATRTARGTGLGLHLVALHAQSVGGQAEVLARPGGGALFRVSFEPAPPDAS